MSELPTALGRTAEGIGDGVAWFVGGVVRDLHLGTEIVDVDIATVEPADTVARRLHSALGGDVFSLSDRFGTWRVQPPDGWRIDITALRGETIEDDLAQRDFTVNAMALALGDDKSATIDPFGGLADLQGGVLRVLGEHAYEDDPLRPLRLARFVASLGFAPDAETAEITRRHAAGVAAASPERIFAELRSLVASSGAVQGLESMRELGLLVAVLPELEELVGVEQSVYHHRDVYGHTLEVLEQLIAVTERPAEFFPDDAEALSELLDEPLADEMTRGQALRWAALLHDVAKSSTRTVSEGGRVGFPGHDRAGAEQVRKICARLHTSDKFAQYVAALTRHHLHLGFLVDARPLERRDVYRYLQKCEPVEVEVGVLSVADRLATRGRKADVAIERHLELARELNSEALAWRAESRSPLIRGDRLAAALGISTGPAIGKLLAAIDEEHWLGNLADEDSAVRLAQRLLDDGSVSLDR